MILTLCGSNRFEPWFKIWNEALSLSGHSVFTTAVYPSFKNGVKNWYTDEEKLILDQVHKAKITASGGIVVLNVMAYIGQSTLGEILHAQMLAKKIYVLEYWAIGNGIGELHRDDWRAAAQAWGIPEGYGSPITTGEFRNVYDLLGPGGRFRSNLVEKIQKVDTDARGFKQKRT